MIIVSRFKYYISTFELFVKSKYQLLRYGYEFRDSWNLYYKLAKWILPRLKHLRNNNTGFPTDLTEEQWGEILDKIIFSFEFILKEDDYILECYPKDYNWEFDMSNTGESIFKDKRKPDFNSFEEKEKKYEEGMQLFVKYYRNLWD